MLGSHNSLTYLPCRKWWMYLINQTAKCQNKTLSEQFHDGVRYFDIRLKWDRKEGWVIAHGLIEYKGDIKYKEIDKIIEKKMLELKNNQIYIEYMNKMEEFNNVLKESSNIIESYIEEKV